MASTFISLPSPASTGPIDLSISAATDSIRVSDGTDTLAINADGSINVSGISVSNVDAVVVGINEFEYNEVGGIAVGATSTLVSRLFPTEYKLRKVSCTGENIAVYTVYFDSTAVDKRRSTFTDFNCLLDYETGITIPAGTTVSVEVLNAGSTVASFSAQLLFSAK